MSDRIGNYSERRRSRGASRRPIAIPAESRTRSKYKYSDQVGWFALESAICIKANARPERRFVYGGGDALEGAFHAHRYLRAKAEQCRGLLKLATDRHVIEQLRLWISDFEADAARIRRATSNDRPGRVVEVIPDEIDGAPRTAFRRATRQAGHL